MKFHSNIATRWVRSLLFLSLFLSWTVRADRDQRDEWTLNLYVENDLFSETDQDYTGGIQLSWVSPNISDYVESEELPTWVRRLNQSLTFFHQSHEGLKRKVIMTFEQQIYTPEDLNETNLIEDDRPYAAWLFLGLGYQIRAEDQLDTLEVQLGIVGPGAYGQEAQDFIHDLRGFEKFKGWDNQLRNEPGIVATWEHKQKWTRVNPETQFGYDAITHTGLSLGNVSTHLNAGAEVRIGWALPDDFGTSAIRPGGQNSTPDSTWDPRFIGEKKWGLHAFASFDIRLVGYDIFLDGNSFKNSHSVTKESVVADAALGIAYIVGGGRLSDAQIFRTKEFSGQDSSHSYGSLSFSYTF